MNERIRELEAQCWEPRSHPNAQAAMGDRFNTEKFAELIIQDCVTQVALLGISNYENKDIMWAVDTSIENIKERFGITQ